MAKYVCVDVGGTFTDAAVLTEDGIVQVFKSPTTHNDYCEGVLNVLEVAAENYDENINDFMKSCSLVDYGTLIHGSTIATNAILEGNVDKVCMIVTHGHRDVLLWREGPIKNPFNYQIDYPEPYIPRHLTLPVRERINSEGNVDVPLNEEDVINAINEFK